MDQMYLSANTLANTALFSQLMHQLPSQSDQARF